MKDLGVCYVNTPAPDEEGKRALQTCAMKDTLITGDCKLYRALLPFSHFKPFCCFFKRSAFTHK